MLTTIKTDIHIDNSTPDKKKLNRGAFSRKKF